MKKLIPSSGMDMTSTSHNDIYVVLVHGFFRTQRDMAFLRRGLERRGFRVLCVELPITRGTIADGVAVLKEQLDQKQLRGKTLAFVGHSMGGLVVRNFLAQIFQKQESSSFFRVSHCVFIATPHRGTPLADLALHIPGVGRFFRALYDLRITPQGSWAAALLHPSENSSIHTDLKVGAIAATRAFILPGRFFISDVNDGMVPLSSALPPDADAVVQLPYNHVTIHKRTATLDAIVSFLERAQFF
jgi:pimeloyl-ACP methyl ester carboxylesterase